MNRNVRSTQAIRKPDGTKAGWDRLNVVVGPPGAIIGGAIGGTVGAGAADAERSRREERVIIEQREPAIRERNCATGPSGATVCEEIRR
jgi:hypothetical protein